MIDLIQSRPVMKLFYTLIVGVILQYLLQHIIPFIGMLTRIIGKIYKQAHI
jgi:hypothetical protein